jgi:hypothetical protein
VGEATVVTTMGVAAMEEVMGDAMMAAERTEDERH